MSHLRVRTIQLSLSIFDCSRPFISCLFLIVFFYFDFAPSPPRQFFSIRQRPPALRIRRRQLRKKERSSGISRRCKKGGDRRANELIVIVGQAVDFILKVLIHHSGILQDPDSRHKGDLFVKEKGSRSKHLPQNPSVDRSSHPKAKARQQLFGGPSTDDRNNPDFHTHNCKTTILTHTMPLFNRSNNASASKNAAATTNGYGNGVGNGGVGAGVASSRVVPATGRPAGGFDPARIFRHPVLGLTFLLAFVGWWTAFISMCVAESELSESHFYLLIAASSCAGFSLFVLRCDSLVGSRGPVWNRDGIPG